MGSEVYILHLPSSILHPEGCSHKKKKVHNLIILPYFFIMIEINPQYEAIFNPQNIDDNCGKIAQQISTVGEQIAETLKVCMYKQAVTMYLQLMKSMANHFVDDEHYYYFDDMYSPEDALQWIYKEINKYKIDEESQVLLDIGHSEIMDSKCYEENGYPSYIN